MTLISILKERMLRSILGGFWATVLYVLISHLVLLLVSFVAPLFFFRMPNFFEQYWAVFPGAVILSFVVLSTAGDSKLKGAFVGGGLAPLNASFSVLLIIVAWDFGVAFGFMEPWKYGFSGLFGEWMHQQWTFLLMGAPIAIPCGAIMGWWLVQSPENGLDL